MKTDHPSIAIPTCGRLDARVRPPGSKSLTNRALVCAALAQGQSRITGLLDSDDTRIMAAALQQVGVEMEIDWKACWASIEGRRGSIAATIDEIYVGNSGTTARFLLPLLATCGTGKYRLNGTERMRQRPMAGLVQALRSLGIEVDAAEGGEMPIACTAHRPGGGRVSIAGDQSSQFTSGVLMSSPYFERATQIEIVGPPVSAPFVEMTRETMRWFGVPTTRVDATIKVQPACYQGTDFAVEPDATAASYFFAAAAITGGRVSVEGLGRSSCQGDLGFVDILRQMGCKVEIDDDRTTVSGGILVGVDCHMGDLSDTVPTLAVVALFADGPTRIGGVAHNRWKESDRIGDLARELRRIGAAVDETEDGLVIRPQSLHGAAIQTYDDHRLAMSLALAGLKVPGITILNPECVQKTYPRFFDDLLSCTSSLPR